MTLKIELGEEEKYLEEARMIRGEVFIREQKIPRKCELDGKDKEATHLIAKLNGKPVGTARIRRENDKAKIERVSVLKPYRGRGFGTKLMEKSIKYCKKTGIGSILLHSQIPLKSFYEKFGFEQVGEPFSEAGVEHIKMVLEPENTIHPHDKVL